MELPIYHVDAFASAVFRGNPAAVVPLTEWPNDSLLQNIAAENNLSETAFFAPEGSGFRLRWFTPTVEVDLCGHATLAAAHVLFARLGYTGNAVRFETLSGELRVRHVGQLLELDFPTRPPQPCQPHADLVAALGDVPHEILAARDYLCVFDSEDRVRALEPDFARLCRIDRFAVIVTALGRDCDFVSRFFAPAQGINEDPVTGSAHCTLTPYWAERLRKRRVYARQVSRRGGELYCEDRGERTAIAGYATLYSEGRLYF